MSDAQHLNVPDAVTATATAYDLAPKAGELVLTFVALVLGSAMLVSGAYELAEWSLPLMIGGIAVIGMVQMVKRHGAAVWTMLFSMRFAAFVYIGIGSLIPLLAGDLSRDYILALYNYSPEEATRVSIACLAGYLSMLMGVKLTSIIKPGFPPVAQLRFSSVGALRLGLVFMVIGLGYAYLVGIPAAVSGAFVLPGSLVVLLTAIGAVGLFLTTLWATEKGGLAFLLPLSGLLAQLLISLILIEKATFILGLLLMGLAFLLQRFTTFRAAMVGLALASSLALMSPMIENARLTHLLAHPELTGGTIGERVDYHLRYLNGERMRSLQGDTPTVFVRLHYTSTSAFVMTQYDVGRPSDLIAGSLYVLIPRAIWPDKPVTSEIGRELNMLIQGHGGNALGIIVFTDAYWNFGWAGLLIFLPVGAFMWWASCVSCAIVASRNWLMMPFVLVAFQIGLSVNNAFVLAWLTPAAIAIVLFFILKAITGTLLSSTRFGGLPGAGPVPLPPHAALSRR